jgi:hypothetical protein
MTKHTIPRINRQALAILLWALMLASCSQPSKSLSVTDVWARPGNAGGTGAVYFTLVNNTDQEDALLSVHSPAAKAVEVHSSMMDENGNMTMLQQDSVPVPAGGKVEFKPGGLHVMLIDLENDLKVNDSFSITLTFERTGEVEVNVIVKES